MLSVDSICFAFYISARALENLTKSISSLARNGMLKHENAGGEDDQRIGADV